MSDVWLSIVMVVVFVLIGGVFSGAEIALVSLRESQVRGMAESGRRGQAVQRLLSDPNRFLAAVQVGVTLAGFFSAAFGASTLSAPLARFLQGRGMSAGLAETVALVLVTIAISYLSLAEGDQRDLGAGKDATDQDEHHDHDDAEPDVAHRRRAPRGVRLGLTSPMVPGRGRRSERMGRSTGRT